MFELEGIRVNRQHSVTDGQLTLMSHHQPSCSLCETSQQRHIDSSLPNSQHIHGRSGKGCLLREALEEDGCLL